MKIYHCSDSHLREFTPEPADIMVHSGDFLNHGSYEELIQFRSWLEKYKDNYKEIWLVAGNHDRIFEKNPYMCKNFLLEKIPNLVYLHHEAYEYEGRKIFGSPYQPFFCNWAFNVSDNLVLYEKYLQIPEDTDILITHCPPERILDRTVRGEKVGSRALKLALPRLKNLKVHMFGHIHYAYGIDYIDGIQYSNGAICGEDYKPTNPGRIIEL